MIAWRKAQEKEKATANEEELGSSADPSGALFEEKKRSAKSKSSIPLGTIHVFELARQNVVDESFAKLAKLDPEGADRAEWMKEAVGLIDIFRETRELFSGNRVRFISPFACRRIPHLWATRIGASSSLDSKDRSMSEGFGEWRRRMMRAQRPQTWRLGFR